LWGEGIGEKEGRSSRIAPGSLCGAIKAEDDEEATGRVGEGALGLTVSDVG